MIKAELVNAVVLRTGLKRKDAELALNAAMDAIIAALAEGDKVQLVGFGTFETAQRAPRLGRIPGTEETVEIPAARVPQFKPGKNMKNAVK